MTHRRATLWIALTGILMLWILVSELIAPRVIRQAHAENSLDTLNRLFEGRDVHSGEHYVGYWRHLARLVTLLLLTTYGCVAIATTRWFKGLAAAIYPPRASEKSPALPPRHRTLLANAIVIGLIVGHAICLVADAECWPFSTYPMYSGLQGPVYSQTSLFGRTARGEEIPLLSKAYWQPFDHRRVVHALGAMTNPQREDQLRGALGYLFRRYHELREAGEHDGPEIIALTVYITEWELGRDAIRPDAPSGSSLVMEYRPVSQE